MTGINLCIGSVTKKVKSISAEIDAVTVDKIAAVVRDRFPGTQWIHVKVVVDCTVALDDKHDWLDRDGSAIFELTGTRSTETSSERTIIRRAHTLKELLASAKIGGSYDMKP